MMYIDYEANTEKEAIQLALDSLGLTEEDVRIEILEKEKKGLFGIGKKEKAKVRIYYKEQYQVNSEMSDMVEVLKRLITCLSENSKVDFVLEEGKRYSLRIETDEPAHLIGKEGRNMKAIQTVVNSIIAKHKNDCVIRVDVDDYHNKRYASIVRHSVMEARKAIETKKAVTLEPMNSYERRLVHIELKKKVPGISTQSEGEGSTKQIKIIPGG